MEKKISNFEKQKAKLEDKIKKIQNLIDEELYFNIIGIYKEQIRKKSLKGIKNFSIKISLDKFHERTANKIAGEIMKIILLDYLGSFELKREIKNVYDLKYYNIIKTYIVLHITI